jgi:hypothetical protein
MDSADIVVEVTLVDGATGESIGVTNMPVEDLPVSFESNTTIHIGDTEWSVVEAQPRTRAECAESRSLVLRLYRIEKINPANILYSLPTIINEIAPIGSQPLEDNELVLAEDDWRQFEFVSGDLAAVVDEELAKVREIHENASASVGWRKIHVRMHPEQPIVCHLSLDSLTTLLGTTTAPAGVTYFGAEKRIANGYSLSIPDDISMYGVAPNDQVHVIGIGRYSDSAPTDDSVERLRIVAREHNLELVNWCQCVRVRPDDELFAALITGADT